MSRWKDTKSFRRLAGIFGFGIIGLGEGKGLVKGLYGHPELRVNSVCDINAEMVKVVQKEFDIPHGSVNYDEMLKREDIDI